MSDPIIVGVDGSAPSDRALDWAADEAVRRGLELHIVHAQETWPYSWPFDLPTSLVPGESAARFDEAVRQMLTAAEERARQGRPDLAVTTELATQSAVEALRERSEKASEVVVGHRGLGGFSSLLLGSVSLRVSERASAPVVIVRGDTFPERREMAVGIDLVDDAPALEYAFQTAAVRGARLRVVHAWHIPEWLLDSHKAINLDELEEKARWSVVEAHAPYRRRFPGVEVVEEVPRIHAVEGLVEASMEVDLLVVGRHGKSQRDHRLGSTCHGVVHHAHCPVAVVRQEPS
ncbi:universal stress protein [Actinomadura barringtoniae]|uniref:Universal stress protein n=1 Tax=Actinomadura barringtoniae TaxID=1427535 RepID=A0A939PLW2_9ACTN|nr:universal stress protein [Actinomadura barringtoniae]MBO2455201.1 universal stress protein [Actinomadura barringtoniae]